MGAPATVEEAVALITPEVRDTYARDGVAVLRQALHPEWLLLLQLGLDRVMGD
ncbi:MAG: phytanoyl-CoA dioxygenase, partial [Actinobacteria bacterium]|nr:phytanoyl-CoA dioxygenase [Actinomycetota bacterium]